MPLQVCPPKFNSVGPGVVSHKRYKVSSQQKASRAGSAPPCRAISGQDWCWTFALPASSQPWQKERGHSDTGNFTDHCRRRSRLSLQADSNWCGDGETSWDSSHTQQCSPGTRQMWPHESHLPTSTVICSALYQCSDSKAQTW